MTLLELGPLTAMTAATAIMYMKQIASNIISIATLYCYPI